MCACVCMCVALIQAFLKIHGRNEYCKGFSQSSLFFETVAVCQGVMETSISHDNTGWESIFIEMVQNDKNREGRMVDLYTWKDLSISLIVLKNLAFRIFLWWSSRHSWELATQEHASLLRNLQVKMSLLL